MSLVEEWKNLKRIFGRRNSVTRLKMFHRKRLKHIMNIKGKSLLHVTAKHGNLAMTKFLVKIGCDINLKDKKNGYTPLSRALYRGGKKCQRIVEFLVKSGADVSWTNVTLGNQSTIIFKDEEIIATLCSALCNREACYGLEDFYAAAVHLLDKGWTLDNIACLKNDSMVSWALNGDLATYYGQLMRAITEQDVDKVKQLLERNAHSIRVTSWGLAWAARSVSPNRVPMIIKLLLDYGAPVNGFPGDVGTPISEALKNHNVYNSLLLLDHGAKLDKFMMFFLLSEGLDNQEDFHDCIRLLMEHRGVPNGINLILEIRRDFRSQFWFQKDSGADRLFIEYLSRHRRSKKSYVNSMERKFFQYPFTKQDKYSEYFSHYVECHRELQRVKKYKVFENVSLLELLEKTIDEMIPLTRNNKLIGKVKSVNFLQEFPCHGKTLQFKINMAIYKRILIDESVKILRKSLPVCLCDLVLEKIVSFVGVPNSLLIV